MIAFAPLVYPHKPGMAAWLTEWILDFARHTPEAVPPGTIYPEPEVESYLDSALRAGIRCVKVHVQVGAFDPRSSELDKAWGMLADAGVPPNGPLWTRTAAGRVHRSGLVRPSSGPCCTTPRPTSSACSLPVFKTHKPRG